MNTGLAPAARDAYTAGFAQALARHSGPSWLVDTRRTAFSDFVELGWPTSKQEDWRFTDVSPITQLALWSSPTAQTRMAEASFDQGLLNLGKGQGHRLVFVDGQYQAEYSPWQALPAHLVVQPLSTALEGDSLAVHQVFGEHLGRRNGFVALNTAFMNDGAFIRIPDNLTVERPIYLVFLSTAQEAARFPRTAVWAGANSQATLVEIHLDAEGNASLSNAATEIVLEPGARLHYHNIQKASATGFHVGHVAVTQKAGSLFSSHSLSLDGRIVRNDLEVRLIEEGCTCILDGLYLATGSSHIDNHTTIDHRMPRSTSREVYKGLVDGRGHAVFNGRIVVRAGAQQTDARQTNKNLVLADGAMVNTKPHLEILANDVKCAHGASIGRLDEDARFYLRSRGIGQKEASRLLIHAFLQEGLDRVSDSGLRQALEEVLAGKVDSLATAGGPT
ncbi:MAG TPA: Fe-S cluster assembly protein SufD [Polyangia bacterium]